MKDIKVGDEIYRVLPNGVKILGIACSIHYPPSKTIYETKDSDAPFNGFYSLQSYYDEASNAQICISNDGYGLGDYTYEKAVTYYINIQQNLLDRGVKSGLITLINSPCIEVNYRHPLSNNLYINYNGLRKYSKMYCVESYTSAQITPDLVKEINNGSGLFLYEVFQEQIRNIPIFRFFYIKETPEELEEKYKEYCSNLDKTIIPRKHSELIKKVAEDSSLKIEFQDITTGKWLIDEDYSQLFNDNAHLRIYNPFKEFEDAINTGKAIEIQNDNGEWEDFTPQNICYKSTSFKWRFKPEVDTQKNKYWWDALQNGESIQYQLLEKWYDVFDDIDLREKLNGDFNLRIKPKPKFKVGDDVQLLGRSYKIKSIKFDYSQTRFLYTIDNTSYHYTEDMLESVAQYEPFTNYDSVEIVGRKVKTIKGDKIAVIVSANYDSVCVGNINISYTDLLGEYLFLDNSPCGKF